MTKRLKILLIGIVIIITSCLVLSTPPTYAASITGEDCIKNAIWDGLIFCSEQPKARDAKRVADEIILSWISDRIHLPLN